ncbi:uncharacterized protein si:dkey-65b12.12 isoform X2 [Hoplias malabaricus]|uniref:uncharacterized protein si:dkey-65b12.12 isoform X2 n=1 Tax=Hoplias malabaricus TaxID=27720 RepID=UPI003462936C
MRLGGWLVFWGSCLMVLVKGNGVCQDTFLGRRNITTELQSDVLLPCIFSADLIRSDTTADIAAVWSQRTVTVDNIVEISLQGEARFWKNYSRRFKALSKLSVSGDFSILLLNVSRSDEGLYQCDLFNGTNCRIAYQEVQLSLSLSPAHQKYIIIAVAGASGGILFLLFTACFFYLANERRRRVRQVGGHEIKLENLIYDPVYYTVQNTKQKEEEVYSNINYSQTPDQHRESNMH